MSSVLLQRKSSISVQVDRPLIQHTTMRDVKPRVTEAWDALAKWTPPCTSDSHWWWAVTGPQLARLLAEGNYTLSEQYETFLFHYHVAASSPRA